MSDGRPDVAHGGSAAEVEEFAVYLAPETPPLSAPEWRVVTLQTADLLGCDASEIRPLAMQLQGIEAVLEEFSHIPPSEQSRDPYLALVTLLRNDARAVGHRCCMLLYDLNAPFPVLDYLKGLAEITRLPVLMAVCRPPAPGAAQRQILVRRLR